MSLIAVAVSLPASWRRGLVVVGSALALGLAVVTTATAGDWVVSSRTAQDHCDSFRSLWAARVPGTPVVVITYPAFLGDAPVFANDVEQALAHCVTGRFGLPLPIHAMGPVVARSAADLGAQRRRDDPAARVFERELDARYAHYDIDSPVEGRAYHEELGTFTVTRIDEQGRARALRIVLAPARLWVLESRGGGFSPVARLSLDAQPVP